MHGTVFKLRIFSHVVFIFSRVRADYPGILSPSKTSTVLKWHVLQNFY
jgi:hypothetical protein